MENIAVIEIENQDSLEIPKKKQKTPKKVHKEIVNQDSLDLPKKKQKISKKIHEEIANQNSLEIPEKEPKIPQRVYLEQFLKSTYHWRFNCILEKIEWSYKEKKDFKVINDYDLNSIQRRAENTIKIPFAIDKIKNTLASDFTPIYDPFKDYFYRLEPLKTTDNITKLASTVTTNDPELFLLSLTKWLVATIANALNIDGCQNQTALVLTGTQGAFKTTWLNLLCPPSLAYNYSFCGKININLESKDTVILLAEKLIINLDDQLRKLNNKDSETVKTLISQSKITVRKPYAQYNSELPRRASFCGSINGKEFLTDTTGSRRFFPFEAQAIDIKEAQSIDMDLVWAEAMQLYKSGYRYYFTIEETNELFKENEAFQVDTSEYELLLEYFEVPKLGDLDIQYLSNTAILGKLKNLTGLNLSSKHLGESLKKAGFAITTKRIGGSPTKLWAVIEKSIETVNLERKLAV
jgi:predicted P-loop ATPase